MIQQKPRRYFIKTYGCQMNVADSVELAEVLESAGYQEAKDIKKADIVLINTCVVRQHAEDRAAGFIASLSGLKKKNPNIIIGICGCLVTEPGRDLKKQFPHVDLFIPPSSPEKLRDHLSRVAGRESRVIETRPVTQDSRLVTIMHGCDNFCTYCVVPYVRGREYSRPMDEVLAEIRGLIEQGITDITLLGQNVNSYKYGLVNLLRKVVPRPSSLVLRFLTSHPRDMSDEIIETVAELPYVAKEFHLPLQSGDNEILRRMNRGYTLEYYLDRVKKIRSLIPQARITTDIMVGFPGETEEQFQNTLRAIETIRFNEVHMFAYSARPETAAAKLPDQLPEEVKHRRLQELIEVVRRTI